MEPFEFVIAIVAIVFGSKLIRDIVGGKRRARAVKEPQEMKSTSAAEERIAVLEGRIQTLERIMTDSSANLAREIDGL